MNQHDVLLTDLYQLAMLQAYWRHDMNDTAVFEFFVRDLPERRNFFVAAGLEQALDYLQHVKFSEQQIDWLRSTGRFADGFLNQLLDWRFQGEVHAMAEGTVFFPDEPVLRVTAPIQQAQLVESFLINSLHYQTLVASKAARCVLAAPDKLLVDFGFRRTHGTQSGLYAARASYIAGFAGTSTVLASQLFNIPIFGTMAHSFIQAHDRETDAFLHFADSNPDNVVLLIDTYDTEEAASKVVALAPRLKADYGIDIRGVRLDSGDLAEHAKQVRQLFDKAGLSHITIFSSGNMDEYQLKSLLQDKGAPIDGFGIGTHLDTSEDVPYLDCAYKLQEYAGKPRRKRSEGKATWPGRKQVFRTYDETGRFAADTVALEDTGIEAEGLLHKVMENGKRLGAPVTCRDIRQHAQSQLGRLPLALRAIDRAADYPVAIDDRLRSLAESLDHQRH